MKVITLLLINLDDRPCDISLDRCGWKNVHGWKRIKYQDLDQDHQDDIGDKYIEVDEGNYFKFSSCRL